MTFVLRQLMEIHWEYDIPMHLAFVDLTHAFDRVPWTTPWNAMDDYQMPPNLKKFIISMYGIYQSTVRVGGGEGEWFDTVS